MRSFAHCGHKNVAVIKFYEFCFNDFSFSGDNQEIPGVRIGERSIHEPAGQHHGLMAGTQRHETAGGTFRAANQTEEAFGPGHRASQHSLDLTRGEVLGEKRKRLDTHTGSRNDPRFRTVFPQNGRVFQQRRKPFFFLFHVSPTVACNQDTLSIDRVIRVRKAQHADVVETPCQTLKHISCLEHKERHDIHQNSILLQKAYCRQELAFRASTSVRFLVVGRV